MQQVNIETSQNVLISYEIATLGDRILAYIIDSLILFAVGMTVGLISAMLATIFEGFAFLLVIYYVAIFFYHLLFEVFNDGQSPGKQQMKIKVVKKDGSQPTIGAYLLRWVIRPIDMGLVAILFIAIGGKGQRLGDLAAGTTVIKLRPQVNAPKQEVIKKMESDYKPTFPEAEQLSSKDVDIILEALKHFKETSNREPVMAIYKKVIDLLKIRTDMEPIAFLHLLVKDYNHYATHG